MHVNKAKENLTRVICEYRRNDLSFDEQYFDCMIFADILEHLKDLSHIEKTAENLSDSGVLSQAFQCHVLWNYNMMAQGRWNMQTLAFLDRYPFEVFTRERD